MSWPRCGADQPPARPATIASLVMPTAAPTAARCQGVVDREAPEARDRCPDALGRCSLAEPEHEGHAGGAGGQHVAPPRRRRPRRIRRRGLGRTSGRPCGGRGGRPRSAPRRRRRAAPRPAPLGGFDGLDRPDPAEVDAQHGGDDADPGPGEARQLGDLAAGVHAHLEHGADVVAPQAEEGQRQSDLVVLVAFAPERSTATRQDGGDGLLGRVSWRCCR